MSYLDYPDVHHAFVRELLTEEAGLEPLHGEDLSMSVHTPSLRSQLDLEIGLADRIFLQSNFARQTFLDAGVPNDKLIVAPYGVDLETFRSPKDSPRDRSIFRVIFVGQMTQRKGISYLFEAFRQAAIPNSELLLVGRPVGTYRGWRSLPGVRHLDHVPRWQLPALYAMADVFVLPSLIDAFGLTALEAMACGLPVVVSENTFGHDVVTDDVEGYVVPIRDPAAIAARLRHLYEHPDERARMGKAAERRAEEFSWDRYGKVVVSAIVSGSGPFRNSE
jgi:glycosyltransferase involved in cell wall biosynthesis